MYSAGFKGLFVKGLTLALAIFFLPAAAVAQEPAVVLRPGEQQAAELGLRPLWPPLQPVPLAALQNHAGQQNPQGRTHYTDAEQKSRKGLYLGASLAVVGGVLAWWSKREANDAYTTYLRSASRKRQDKQMDRAERFDRIAGGAFALMEAGVVLSVYFTFLDTR